jgi:iron complex outermembrane receptor protein
MKCKLLLALLPAVCLCVQTRLTYAQQSSAPGAAGSVSVTESRPATTGRIAGVLKDPSGAVVPGAKIDVRNSSSGLAQSLRTNAQGRFACEGIPAGRYQITVQAAGFEAASIHEVSVRVGSETKVEIALKIAPARTDVEVTTPGGGAESLDGRKAGTSDTAALLEGTPGLDLAANGGVSSLPALHGLGDDRVKVVVNGMTLTPQCSNHMNPPLSYIDPGNVGNVSVVAGITPVSSGGDSLGGTITVDSAEPEFATVGQRVAMHGGVTGFHRTNGVVSGGEASLVAATGKLSARYTGTYVNSGDYTSGAGARVISTLYESRTYNAQLAARRGNHLLTLDVGYQDIPEQGFVNAHMDMLKNESRFANVRYRGTFGWGKVNARAFYERTGHAMNILSEKMLIMNMNMPMETKGANLGYLVKTEIPLGAQDTLRAGTEMHRVTLDDWWPASMTMTGSMGPNTLWNVRDGWRNRFGTYVEWEGKHGRGWTELLGVRNDEVAMDTGNVQGYNMVATLTGSAAYYADAMAFNAVRHARRDHNFDLTALGRYEPGANSTYEFGYARKTRSPNLYERYLWVKQSAMSVDMNGWFGDLNGYTGNLNLRPEVANTVSVSAGWHDADRKQWELKLTPYFTTVQDYIDAGRCPISENGLGNGCTAARFNATRATLATTPYVTLQFGNYGAQLVGVDGQGRFPLGSSNRVGSFSLNGTMGYVHGKNTDAAAAGSPGQEPLYRLMPLHAKVALEHRLGNWSSAFDVQAVGRKDRVEAVRLELPTPGYALANLRTGYERRVANPLNLRFDAGIDNLTGRNYVLPLGGRYYGPTMAAIKAGTSVPGMGRSFHGSLSLQF